MTTVKLLEDLAAFTREHTADLRLPAQPGDEELTDPPMRAPAVYYPALPDLRRYARYAPFVTHEVVTAQDGLEAHPSGAKLRVSTATVRTCFCVYHQDAREGRLYLLQLMERIRVPLLESCVVGGLFRLDQEAGVEYLVYPVDANTTAVSPFYLGEMLTVWKLPIVERKVPFESYQDEYRGGGYA